MQLVSKINWLNTFLQWAIELADKLLKLHKEEVNRRQEFNQLFEGHFLKSLFPGMTELPPPFATQAPPVFDGRLPQLTDADVEYIAKEFSKLAEEVPQYDMDATVRFFQQRLVFYKNAVVRILFCSSVHVMYSLLSRFAE